MSDSDLVESTLALLRDLKRKTCTNCWHGREGGCLLYSCSCADSIALRKSQPTRWTSYEEGERNRAAVLGWR